jgi:hypothetical protein
MEKILTQIERKKFFDEIYKFSDFVNKLDNYELASVLSYSEDVIYSCEARAYELFNGMPQYIEMIKPTALEEGYPQEKLWDYILSKDFQFIQASSVIQVIKNWQIKNINPEIKVKKGRKPVDIDLELKLSKILLQGIPIDEIKNRCKDKRNNYIGLYLYRINEKNYFKRKLLAKELGIIGNEIKEGFKWSKGYNKEPKPGKFPDLKNIPDPKTLIKT